MLELKKLSDNELLSNTKALVGEEHKIIQDVLQYLLEIENRKIYLARGCSSLFDFCVTELKYSQGSASRRISSMLLIKQVPQALDSLKQQKVNLSTMAQLQGAVKREEKRTGKSISVDVKTSLLETISNKSQKSCERELLKAFPQDIVIKEKERALTAELTEIKIIASKTLMEKLAKLKILLAHKKANPSNSELIELLADMALKKLDLTIPSQNQPRSAESGSGTVSRSGTKSRNGTESRKRQDRKNPAAGAAGFRQYISKELKKRVWLKSENKCQYVDKIKGKKCASAFALQIDHIHPLYFGGESNLDNLRLLCRNHNSWLGKQILDT